MSISPYRDRPPFHFNEGMYSPDKQDECRLPATSAREQKILQAPVKKSAGVALERFGANSPVSPRISKLAFEAEDEVAPSSPPAGKRRSSCFSEMYPISAHEGLEKDFENSPLKKIKLSSAEPSPERNEGAGRKLAFGDMSDEEESFMTPQKQPQASVFRPHLPDVDDHIAALLRPVDTSPFAGYNSTTMPPPTPARRMTVSKTPRQNVLERGGLIAPDAVSPFAGYNSTTMPPPTPARNRRVVDGSRKGNRNAGINDLASNFLGGSPLAGRDSNPAFSLSPFGIHSVRSGDSARRRAPGMIGDEQPRLFRPIIYRSASSDVSFQKGRALPSVGQHMKVHPVIADQPLFPGYANKSILAKFYKDGFSDQKIDAFIESSLVQYRLSQTVNGILLKLDLASRGINANDMRPEEYQQYCVEREHLVGYPTVKILNADTLRQDRFLFVEKVPYEFKVDLKHNEESLKVLPQGDILAQVKRFLQISYDPLDYIASKIGEQFYLDFQENYHPYLQSKDYKAFKETFYPDSALDADTLFYGALKKLFHPHLQIDDVSFYRNLKKLYPDAQKSNFRVREDGTVVMIDFMEHEAEQEHALANPFGELLHNCLTTFSGVLGRTKEQEALYLYLMPAGWNPNFDLDAWKR